MEILATADLGAVARNWAAVKKDLPTHAPNFYMALLTAHPEYHQMFSAIAHIPMSELAGSAALKTLSISVLSKLDSLLSLAGTPDDLAAQLVALGADHKKMGIKPSDFDNLGVVLVNFLASALGAGFTAADRAAWITTVKGINAIIATAL